MNRSWLKKTLVLCLLAMILAPAAMAALHPYYEQNGDCYVLICDGPYRGVYALNNLTGGSVQKIWNLKDSSSRDLDAYGIAAAQSWDGTTSQKRLYIFAGIDSGWQPWSGIISRRVIVWPDPTGVYGRNRSDPSGAPDRIIHRYHSPGRPGDSPTGRGNHCANDYCHSLPNIFGGTCYPCSIVPAATPGKPGYYDVPAGNWFHCLDHPVWSPYTYGWGSSGGGGWVHYVCRENVQAKFRDIKLHMLNRNTLGINPSPYPTSVANVKTGEKSTIDQRGECVDGCIRAVDGLTGPAGDVPYLDCAYSSIGKAYLYRREIRQTTYNMLGKDGNTTIVGDPSNLTTTSIGVSSKNTTGDFVYTVGKDVINSWLSAAGAPYTIATLTDFAVSDQWWQTGGIAYVYDKTLRTVYKFVRNDLLGTTPIPEQINVGLDGVLPDSIGADGFGHLYLMKTRFDPANINAWSATNAYTYSQYFVDTAGNRYVRAYFRQGVYKTVSKRNYYTRVTAPISGDIPLGTNTYFRDFIVRAGQNIDDRSTWSWISGFTQMGASVNTDYRVEIAVINSATPPQVEGDRNGLNDVRGPLLFSLGTGDFNPAAPLADGRYGDDNVYFFEVENYPRFDTNDVNTWSGDDIDLDGRRGQFVSTIKKTAMKYYWKVVQTKDRSGGVVNNTILDQEAANTPGGYRYSAALSAGTYQVGVKTQFQFYDYDRLAPGSLAQDKESVLTGVRTAVGEDTNGYSWITFTIKGIDPPPTGTGGGIVMSGKPQGGSTFLYKPTDADTFPAPLTRPKFVIPDQNIPNWSFKLRDLLANCSINPPDGRLTLMNNARPPIPAGIARMVPNSNVWTPAATEFTWSSLLKRGSETIIDVSITTDRSYLTPAETRRLFPVPSQPQSYTLTANARRVGTVQAYFPTPVIYSDGTLGTDWGLPTDVPIVIQMAAVCDVIVKDQTGPQVTYSDPFVAGGSVPGFFVNRNILYGTTGETIWSPTSPPVAPPSQLIFVVADNNPMGNDSTSNTYIDIYHNNVLINDLRVNHNYNARYAEFYYPTVPDRSRIPANYYRSNPVQNNNIDASYKLQQQDLVEANFGTGDLSWLPGTSYNRAFSYRMYKIALLDMVHFSDQGAPLRLDMANNVSDYHNPVYGLAVKDASEIGLSSTEPANYLGRGEIVIRDNDRPNAFIQAQELKHEGVVHIIPSNLVPSLLNQWIRIANPSTSDAAVNGLQSWSGTSIGSIDSSMKVNSGLPVSTVLASPKAEFEVDVPAFFHPVFYDNLGQVTVTNFSLYDLDGTTVLDNRTSGGDIRYLFRQPTTATGKYRVKLQICDNARGWPSDPRRPYETATMDDLTRNKRDVELQLDVYASRLDIRVIDRTNQGK